MDLKKVQVFLKILMLCLKWFKYLVQCLHTLPRKKSIVHFDTKIFCNFWKKDYSKYFVEKDGF